MKAPGFWFVDSSAPAQLLGPVASIYGAIAARRMARPGARVAIPVVTIGNFVAGGAGKTPAALAIARLLLVQGARPAFLSRGHGGSRAFGAPAQVEGHCAAEVGDEPLLLARVAPTFIGADRAAAAALAIATVAPTVLVLDDGLQSRRVEPDLAIAMVDGETGVGNGLCLPAGPLRAPLAAQLRHADAVVIVGAGAAGEAVARVASDAGVAVFRAAIEPDESARALAGKSVVAFAGIGRPEKFFATLEKIGARIVDRRAFGDHHRYRRIELDELARLAQAHGAELVTTEKDLARLPPGAATAVAISMTFEPGFVSFLLTRVAEARKGRGA